VQTERMCKRCGGPITERRYNATICIACHRAERPVVFAAVRSCIVCSAAFAPRATNQLTCGAECHYLRHKHGERATDVWRQRQLGARPCAGCGVAFEPARSDQAACSKRCARLVWARQHPEQVHQRRARTRGVPGC
jgi:predicted nucleic acid-binding Zn ribbon protein